MKRSKKCLLQAIVNCLIYVSGIQAFIIDQPGQYNLGGNLFETGDVITIAASSVILDLEQHLVGGGIRGIVINDNLTGVTVRNGVITSLLSDGIVVGQNSTNINLNRLAIVTCGGNGIVVNSGASNVFMDGFFMSTIEQTGLVIHANTAGIRFSQATLTTCARSAVSLEGLDDDNQVSNVLIDQVLTTSCSFLPTSTVVYAATFSNNVFFRNLIINHNGDDLANLSVVRFNNCTQCFGNVVQEVNNVGSSIIGYDLRGSSSCVFQNCNVLTHTAISGDLTGFLLTDTSQINTFLECSVFACQANAGDAIGFDMKELSMTNVFEGCRASALLGNNVYGFRFNGSGTPSNTSNNQMRSCTVARNWAQNGESIGIEIDRSDCGTIEQCLIVDNTSVTGLSIGLRFTSSGGGNNWSVNDSQFIRNMGNSDANSFGIRRQTGTGNLFIQNFAFNNGTTTANQMSGVPLGSMVQLNSTNLNSSNDPWSNIVIIP